MGFEVRTRFAPSPTGYMHIGNLRTALYEYLIAKSQGGKFILRIEDTDQERFVEGAVDLIYKALKTAGMQHDEGPDVGGDYGPYVQSERKGSYLKYAEDLIAKGEAYYCFCTKERLEEMHDKAEAEGRNTMYDRHCLSLTQEEIEENLKNGVPYVIRQKMPTEGETSFSDVVYGNISIANEELEDQILIKTDGYPTYNFANVIDDHQMKITHVVRGSEYLTSTPKYNLLYDAFGWEKPVYVHLPLIVKPDGSKLSKRAGDASFEDLLNMGYLPEAIINYIALLGWSPDSTQEFFSLQDLEREFSAERISKSPSAFDIDKLRWMNAEYIRNMTDEEFCKRITPYLKESIKNEKIDLLKVSKILKQRTEVLTEVGEKVTFLENLPEYDIDIYIHKKMKTTYENSLSGLEAAVACLEAIDAADWNEQVIHDCLMNLVQELGCKNGQLLWPIRTALSGLPVSPGGAMEIADILGKEETLRRLAIGIEKLK